MSTTATAVVVSSASAPNSLTSKTNHQQLLSSNAVSYYSSNSNYPRRLIIKTRRRSSSSSSSGRSSVIRSFYEAAPSESLYEVLGISESTCSSDIKKAYKEMARKYHPDVSPPERVDEYTRKFISVHEAYETLSDPHSRALYDRALSSANFNFSSSPRHHHPPPPPQRKEDQNAWTMRWQSQLDGLKRRRSQTSGRADMSWGARMRSQTQRPPSSSS